MPENCRYRFFRVFRAALYELLTGNLIYAELNPGVLIKKITTHEFTPLSTVNRDLAAIVEKSLAFDPADRYTDMNTIAADLRRFLAGEAVMVRRAGTLHRCWLWSKRRPVIAALTGGILLLTMALIASLTVGYYRTQRTLKIADATLNEIYSSLSDRSGKHNTALLVRRLPYYEAISSDHCAYAIIGSIALHSGDPALAESAFRQTGDHNLLAESLFLQGKITDAQDIGRELASHNDVEAVKANRSLAGRIRALPGREAILASDPAALQQSYAKLKMLAINDAE